ncbi:MAG: lipoyl(octanoyl) transferase LipB [Gammaproteobacteria bacterium]|nr:MAG: lipoyl(octanoyl) transferase LipB [Gammaproteobacteria bacterium]
MDAASTVRVRHLGVQAYEPMWQAMKTFTDTRTAATLDELWCLQHPPVFTLGQAGKREHILNAGDIPVVASDRGGQVTYHGPGQWVVYLLTDIRRKHLGPRQQVDIIEHAIIATLAHHGVIAANRPKAPGVYVGDAKIAQLGLRIRKGASYHGLSLNVDMDLAPFTRIHPCGYEGLRVTRLVDEVSRPVNPDAVLSQLLDELCERLGYTARIRTDCPWDHHE